MVGSIVFALIGCGWMLHGATALLTPLSDCTERSSLLVCGATNGRRRVFTDVLAVATGVTTAANFSPQRAAAVAEAPPPSWTSGTTKHGTATDPPLLSVESAARLESLKLRLYPDPVLRTIVSPVRTSFGSRELERVIGLLLESMSGNATTALQYGIDARIVVLRGASSPDDDGVPLVLINPNVLARSSEDKMVPWRESCGVMILPPPEGDTTTTTTTTTTFGGTSLLEVDLLRDAVVEVAAQDVTGKPVRKALSGEAARAFQHELDHLNGILIVDHADLADLPAAVAERETAMHRERQKRAFERTLYGGNGPLYW